MTRSVLALCIVAALAACSGAKQTDSSKEPVTHDQLRIAFRATFLHSCETKLPGPQGVKYCSCTEDKLESIYSDADLAKVTPDDPKFRTAMHECAAKSGLQVKLGQ